MSGARPRERPARAAIVASAHDSIVRGSRSFAAASLLFAPTVRERAWLLYAWCRAGDDIADGQVAGHGMQVPEDARARVAALRTLTEAVLAGRMVGEPAFDGLGLVAAETSLPPAWPHALIDGFVLDAEGWRPRTEADLLRYCWHVAGVVGCMMSVVMGVSPDDAATLDRAAELGMAFQLANIARDLAEDAAAGRCYLPADWLAAEGVAADDLVAPANRLVLARLAERLTSRAAVFEASARTGAAALSFRSAWAVLAAAAIYGGIGREVSRRGEHAWDTRVSTTAAQKLRLIASAWVGAWRRTAIPPATTPEWRRPG